MMRTFLRTSAALALGVIAGTASAQDPAPEYGYGWEDKDSVSGTEFMVSAANPIAAKAGYDVLAAGGTAADAMIAVQLMLNLVEPQSSGIGGGAFMLYWDAESETLTTFDAREKAPAKATPERFLNAEGEKIPFAEAISGGQAVGVPGILRLMEVTHNLYGKKDWASLFQSTIEQAENGFEVSPRMANSIQSTIDRERYLDVFPGAKEYFFNEDGSPLAEGTLLKKPGFRRDPAYSGRSGCKRLLSWPDCRRYRGCGGFHVEGGKQHHAGGHGRLPRQDPSRRLRRLSRL